MNVFTRPVRYLALVDEKGRRLFRRNLFVTLILATLLGLPFALFDDANFFHPGGFVERTGSFSSVLTGFYIAGLVAVATFAAHLGDLDTPIAVGKVLERGAKGQPDDELSRREYVCALFGYLAFLSLFLSIISIVLVVIAPAAEACTKAFLAWCSQWLSLDFGRLRATAIFAYTLVLASLLVHTMHGLYYLVDRLYRSPPKILPKNRPSETDDLK